MQMTQQKGKNLGTREDTNHMEVFWSGKGEGNRAANTCQWMDTRYHCVIQGAIVGEGKVSGHLYFPNKISKM